MYEISFGNEIDMNIDILMLLCDEMQNGDVEMFGDFDLDGDRFIVINDFDVKSYELKLCFGGILDFEIEKLFLVKKIKI